MKSTKQFIEQYRLDQENFEFSREDFLSGLNEYFLELLLKSSFGAYRNISEWELISESSFGFDKFKNVITQVEIKFWAISNKKVGEPFTKNLWSAFYAIYVIPVRAKIYPEIDCLIKQKRQNFIEKRENIHKS